MPSEMDGFLHELEAIRDELKSIKKEIKKQRHTVTTGYWYPRYICQPWTPYWINAVNTNQTFSSALMSEPNQLEG